LPELKDGDSFKNGRPADRPSRDLRPLWTIRGVISETLRGFRADRGADLAGSLAFTTLLTAVPLVATFSLFLVTFFHEYDDEILAILNAVLPYSTARLSASLQEFVTESTAISGVGLALLVLASVRLVFVVEGIFNAVWGAPRRKARVSRFFLYVFALAALGLVLGGIGWGLRTIGKADADSVLNSPAIAAVVPFLLKAFFLTLIYRYVPNARVRLAPAAVAGGTVALGLEVLRVGFALYVEALMRMNLIAGSLGFALFAIVSLYFAWAFILFGVELTHVLQRESSGATTERQREGRAEKAIRMLLRMSSVEPSPLKDLETNPDSSPADTLAILEDLKNAGLIEGNPGTGFRLAASGRQITVAKIIDALSPGLLHVNPHGQDRVAAVLEPLFDRLESERRALLGTTLTQLRPRPETGRQPRS
jgi:membrane protein